MSDIIERLNMECTRRVKDPLLVRDTVAELAALRADNERLRGATLRDADEYMKLHAENERLRGALQQLHDNVAEYARINNLGGYDNHDMVAARAALRPPALDEFHRIDQEMFHDQHKRDNHE